MIRFENGRARLLPEPDGTIDLHKRALELEFLEALGVQACLGNDTFLILPRGSPAPDLLAPWVNGELQAGEADNREEQD